MHEKDELLLKAGPKTDVSGQRLTTGLSGVQAELDKTTYVHKADGELVDAGGALKNYGSADATSQLQLASVLPFRSSQSGQSAQSTRFTFSNHEIGVSAESEHR